MDFDPLVRVYKDLTPPGDRPFWTHAQPEGQKPVFSTRQAAMVFFGKDRSWLQINLGGEAFDIAPRTRDGHRQLQLHHIELIAHAFLERGIIDLATFTNCIHIIRGIGRNYRLIER